MLAAIEIFCFRSGFLKQSTLMDMSLFVYIGLVADRLISIFKLEMEREAISLAAAVESSNACF